MKCFAHTGPVGKGGPLGIDWGRYTKLVLNKKVFLT